MVTSQPQVVSYPAAEYELIWELRGIIKPWALFPPTAAMPILFLTHHAYKI